MEIVHHISLSAGAEEVAAFRALGIQLASGFSTFKVAESDPHWAAVEELAKRFQAVDVPLTSFSGSEIDGANYLCLLPGWHDGYPQPADDFGYLNRTYDLSKYCTACGVGKRQKAPFSLKKAPSWGRRGVVQLNWIFDEYFVPPEVWEQVFKPFGVESLEVLSDKTGEVLPSVLQLVSKDVTSLEWHGDYLSCPLCNRRKFLPVARGFYPAPLETGFAMAKSREEFGSGASAHHLILISQELRGALRQYKGAEVAPCSGRV